MSNITKYWKNLDPKIKKVIKKYSIQLISTLLGKLLRSIIRGTKKTLEVVEPTQEVTVIEIPVKPKEITWKASPNWSSRKGSKIEAIVLHHTGKGGMKSAVSWFKTKKSGVSAHYIVDRDGTIVQMVKDENKAWHSGVSVLHGRAHVNRFSIGIEIVSTGEDGYTNEQYDSVVFLCKMLKKKYDIENNWIVGHNVIAPGRKVDPKGFNWNKLFDMIDHK